MVDVITDQQKCDNSKHGIEIWSGTEPRTTAPEKKEDEIDARQHSRYPEMLQRPKLSFD